MTTDTMIETEFDTNQYLTFSLGNENFALEITAVREVLDLVNITKIPRTPDYMKGVINLRGNVVPIIDLRLNLGMEAAEHTVDSCIIIAEIDLGGDLLQIGALADSVQEVVDIDPNDIEAAPKIGSSFNTDFIKGMGKRNDEFVIILDVNKVLSAEELSALKELSTNNLDDEE